MPTEHRHGRAKPGFLFEPGLQNAIRVLAFAAAVVFIASLFYVGSKPIAVRLFPSPYDHLAHLLAFGVLTLLLWLAMFRTRPVLLVLLVALVGALDEWHQMSLPGRAPSLDDWLFDVLAAVMAVSMLRWMQRREP
jgi:VanZ family protein